MNRWLIDRKPRILIVLFGLVLGNIVHCKAQTQTTNNKANEKYLVLINNSSNKEKQIRVGEKIKLKLTNSTKVKGTIVAIDNSAINVSNMQINLHEIMKLSTKKGWIQGIGVGLALFGVVLAGTDAAAATTVNLLTGEDEESGEYLLPGLIAAGVGVAMALPNYHEMGKFSLEVVDNEQVRASINSGIVTVQP